MSPPLYRIQRFFGVGDYQSDYSSLRRAEGAASSRQSSFDKNSEDGLLGKEEKERLHLCDDNNNAAVHDPFWRSARFWTSHAVVFGLYVLATLAIANGRDNCPTSRGIPFSPAVEALEYQATAFTLEDLSSEEGRRYTGRPNAAVDQAWHDLLDQSNIMLEPEVLRHYGREEIGIALPDGGGYLGMLNVYHQLHCVKRMHQLLYPDYYYSEFTPKQLESTRIHNVVERGTEGFCIISDSLEGIDLEEIDERMSADPRGNPTIEHCIDFLRQSIMCQGDVGLLTFEWHDDILLPVANATTHQCVNWDKLEQWTQDRSIDIMRPGWLIHPGQGPAFPNGSWGLF